MSAVREFLRVVLARHRLFAIGCAVLTAAVAGLASLAAAPTYYAEGTLYVVEPAAVHRLANPFAPVPSSSRELADVPEVLTSREKLVALVKRTGLLDSWDRGRPPLLRLKDGVMDRLRGPIDEKERLEALVAMLERRVIITVQGSRVKVAAEWTSSEVAHSLVETQMGALMRLRMQREAKTLEEAARSLDEQHEGVRTEMTARALRIESALNQAAGWAEIEAESEQLARDQSRAAELMVQAEEKHIAAEVFRQSNALRFTVMQPATRPRAPNGLGWVARLLVGLLASLLAGAECAALLGLASGRLLTRRQLEAELGLPVLGWFKVGARGLLAIPSRRSLLLGGLLALATGAAVGLTRSTPLFSVLPPLVVVGGWLLWTRPLKWPVLMLMLLCVILDDPSDRAYVGLWQSPLWPVGRLFFSNIALFTGAELAVFGLSGVMLLRRLWFDPRKLAMTDPVHGQAPRPLQLALVVSGLTVGWLVLLGVGRGGDFREALWQFRFLLLMPFVAMLVMYALDLPRDLPKVLGVLVIGSLNKALLGTYFMYAIAFPQGVYPPHTTGHNDTMIFVTAVVAAAALLWERPSRRHVLLALLWLPFVAMALKLNDRRIAYVDIILALGLIFALSPWHPVKRQLTRFVVMMLPVLLLYTAAGWNSHSTVFAPVHKLRSIVLPEEDTEEESSNVERDIENFNLMKSWEQNMLFGRGFGHAFAEFIPSNDFRQSNFGHVGHNSILWLLWIGGIVGFTGVLGYLAVGFFFLGRALERTGEWRERVALLVALSIMLTYLMQAFGDMGTQSVMFDFFVGTALAIVGRLATKHGVWRALQVAPPATVAQRPEAIRV